MREEVKLGNLAPAHAGRDAIHVAVASVEAAEDLTPGQHVGLDEAGRATPNKYTIGIVDPYLRFGPRKGERFFLCLYPQTITSLRHQWSHPAFPAEEKEPDVVLTDRAYSERWLREYATRVNTYDEPEEAFLRLIEDLRGDCVIYHGRDMHSFGELLDPDELKHHAERYLGISINWGMFTFSCSC